ncbi:hypothetical protein TSTA_008650 [Talaromyces stipitatus ATCC 10500]|uniref:DDE-1 domain-containing protein n=1 Tax=Talaromyces stipitatus (strain ATCC 10500 / CBS 375.48 / QM 6759 / NRRL 1006) TaxID=441959 RepID=B8MVB3_TALSN|nr:uncharacterized protein TSTA_008650 [Talaromyces stipitatus ATCC 10500]EED11569.1 hypothetical protein TSTA_008650 [Talaromyces stipitatus ATCC 10500]
MPRLRGGSRDHRHTGRRRYRIGPSVIVARTSTSHATDLRYPSSRYPDALRHVPSSSSRELVPTIEGISAVGNTIPPLLIFTGKVILESWFQYLKEDEWKVTISETGFSNDEIAYDWLKHFNEHTREQAGNNFPHLGGYFYDKIDFLANIARVRADALTPRVIRNGFSARGLWPFNPEIIVGPLIEKWDLQEGQELLIYDGNEEPDISSSPTNGSFSPPTTTYKLQRSITKVDAQLNEISNVIPSIRRSLKKIFDGSLTQAHLKDQQQAQIERIQTLNERKSAKKKKKISARAIKKRATAEEKKAERKRLKELRQALLGSMHPPLTPSDEAAIDRNTLLNLIEQAYPRCSDPNLIRWVDERM